MWLADFAQVSLSLSLFVVCACLCARARARACVCVCACVRACCVFSSRAGAPLHAITPNCSNDDGNAVNALMNWLYYFGLAFSPRFHALGFRACTWCAVYWVCTCHSSSVRPFLSQARIRCVLGTIIIYIYCWRRLPQCQSCRALHDSAELHCAGFVVVVFLVIFFVLLLLFLSFFFSAGSAKAVCGSVLLLI